MKRIKQGVKNKAKVFRRTVTKKVSLLGKAIPVWALIAVVCAGTVAASYLVWDYTFKTTVTEPITVEILEELPTSIDPGMGTCAKYLIHNSGEAPLEITVKMSVNERTELEGFSIVYSNEAGEYCPLHGMPEVVINTEDEQYTTYIFTIGTYDYVLGEDWEASKGMSSYAKIFAGFKVKQDAAPGPLDMYVQVFRG